MERGLRLRLLFALLLILVVPAQDSAAAPPPSPGPKGSPAVELYPKPPDGHWLTDDAGRHYFVDKIPKSQARRLDEHTVKTAWSIPIEVVSEDSSFFYFKVYEVIPIATPEQPAPSPEERARLVASYHANTRESHRLRFVPFGEGLPKTGQWRDGFTVADMNGDGHPDIVSGPPRKSLGASPSIFLGDGHGQFALWKAATFPRLAYDYGDAQVGDLNRDGHLDMVLGNHLRGLIALVGDGTGHFESWGTGLDFANPGSPTGVFSSRALQVVDWNRDGWPDILALGEGPRISVGGAAQAQPSYGVALLLNGGEKGWTRQPVEAGRAFGSSLTLGDFNGDGRTDFATASATLGYKRIVGLGTEDGSFTLQAVDAVRSVSYVQAVAAGDFDRDGRSDLALAYLSFELGTWKSGIDILYPRADGTWQRRALVSEDSRDGVVALATGDLDGDGSLDLVALTSSGETWVFLGDGKGFLTRETGAIPAFAGACRGAHVVLADLDGDGKAEIVASFADEPSPESPGHCASQGGIAAWKAVPR